MVDVILGNIPRRRVLQCVSEEWKTEAEIEVLHSQMYPRELEAFIKASNLLRRKVFREKPLSDFSEHFSYLIDCGYIEIYETDFLRTQPPKKSTYYCLSPEGRSALLDIRKRV